MPVSSLPATTLDRIVVDVQRIKSRGVLVALALIMLSVSTSGAERVRFNQQIRPLLSDRCFACHGPDAKRREADLRLDLPPDAIGESSGPSGIVPRKPDESPLWKRITSTDPDEQMPPPSAKKPHFTPDELKLIRQWIEEGAEYEGHWAFLPLGQFSPPKVSDRSQGAIDAFVRSKLAATGIKPSPTADRATLLRRVTLDLTGLNPTPDEIEEFLNDRNEDAYERVVDRLLASPHYGERWGRHWLDQARYADSNGYAIDAPRDMWPFRDWVIEAFNCDQPFDQFTIEQLAGDLLPQPSKMQLIATGFHRNTLINQEGGSDREQFRVEATMDRVNTTGTVWLGLTVGCAQCHTHKFDPITQREYYELFAFFNAAQDANDRAPTIEVRRGEVFGVPEALPVESTPLSKEQIAKLRADWEESAKAVLSGSSDVTEWSPLKYETLQTASMKGEFRREEDNSLVFDRKGSTNERYLITGATELAQVAAIRLRVLMHDSLPHRGPGTAGNGNFVLSDFVVRVAGQKQTIQQAFADHEQPGHPVSATIDDERQTGWAINIGQGSTAKMNANHEAIFVLAKPIDVAGRNLTIELGHDVNRNYLIGRFAIDVTATVPDVRHNADRTWQTALLKPASQRTTQEEAAIRNAFEKVEPRANSSKKEPNPRLAQYMVMRDQPQPRETFVFTRGDFTRPDKAAGQLSPGVLSAVPPAGTRTRTRLDLANWLVSSDNPLTPRVTVNRIWMHYFGRGIVETEEDFGTQGLAPTHPELLDWLSREFLRQGWSQKAMHRQIACSDTYQQSSHDRADLNERDPRNLLLARQQRLRIEAEITRDVALAASGLLDSSLGGPSVFPPQPAGVYAFTQVNKSWPTETSSQRFRRTLYTFYYRSAPYPLFTTFDAPDFQTACTRRPRSNTPLQALTLANDAVFLELARGLASRIVREVPGDFETTLRDRITLGTALCFGRAPTKKEQSLLYEFAIDQSKEFATDQLAAEKLQPAALRDMVPSAEGATFVMLARILLNADSFITRE